MRVVLNTHVDDPSSRVCIDGLHRRLIQSGVDATLNDWEHYDRYEVVVFLGYDHDIDGARRRSPNIRVAIADPKLSEQRFIEAARDADFLMVSSIEQRDTFYRLNRNILIFYMFPPMPAREQIHVKKETTIIGYHGNRVHLECMIGAAQSALNEIGKRRKIEFWAMYNFSGLGRADMGMPDPRLVPTRHIQWQPDRLPDSGVSNDFVETFSQVDIAIMPSEMPIRDKLRTLETSVHWRPEYKYEPFDHLVRFKASANPGRLYPFARLGIPVVADFTPSASQFIRDGESGFIVSSPYGWSEALEALIDSPQLRQRMANALRTAVDAAYDRQVDQFLEFCRKPLLPKPDSIEGYPTPGDELARLPIYPQYRRGSPLRRWWGRVVGILRRFLRGR